MKCFIVGATKVVYHPKDENGRKMMNVNKNAVTLHLVQEGLYGFETESMFVGEDMDLYELVFDKLGATIKELANWSVEIDRNSGGYLQRFVPVKHYDNLVSGLADTFSIKGSDK